MVVLFLQLFSFVEINVIRKLLKHESLSTKTFMNFLEFLSHQVEFKISKDLTNRFALVINGRISGEKNFVAVF